MKKTIKVLLLLFVGIFVLGEASAQNTKPLDSLINITNISATQANNYWQTCFGETNNNDNARGAYYVGSSVNPRYGYVYSSSSSNQARSVLDNTSMLIYNPNTFSTNGQFTLLSNIAPNELHVKITKPVQNIPVIDNIVGRNSMAGLFVLKGEYRTVLLGSNNSSNVLGYRTDYNQTSPTYLNKKYTFTGSPVTRYSCAAYYVAKCGDGVVDNPNKPGGSNTDGKNGILADNTIIPWYGAIPNEVCDDGINNGQVGFCNTSCNGYVEPEPTPTCVLTATEKPDSSFDIAWEIFGPFNSTQIKILPNNVIPNIHPVTSPNGIVNVVPNGYGVFQAQMTVSNHGQKAYVCKTVFEKEKSVCGDKQINRPNDDGIYEECDNGPLFGNGCDSNCKLITPSCELILDSNYQIPGTPITFNATKEIWARFYSFNLGDTTIIHTGNIIFPYQHIYTNMMNYHQVLTVENNHPNIATGVIRPKATCEQNVQVIKGCEINITPNTINLGEEAKLSWEIYPNFLSPALLSAYPLSLGTWPYNVTNQIGHIYVGSDAVNTGDYIFTLKAETINGMPFWCTGQLNIKDALTGKLDITKTLLTTGELDIGDFVDYQITLTNIGSGIYYDAYITDVMPKALDLISHNIVGIPSYNSGQWQDAYGSWYFEYSGFDLNPGQTVYVNLRGQIRSGASIHETTNCVYTIGTGCCVDIKLSKKPFIQKYQSVSNSDFTTPFTSGDLNVNAGDLITYKIEFANLGLGNAYKVRLTDHMPLCVKYVSASIYGVSDYDFSQTIDTQGRVKIEYFNFNLNSRQTGYVIITGKVVDTDICKNQRIYKNDSYLLFSNPTKVEESSVVANKSLKSVVVLTKDSDPDIHVPGDDKRFEINVTNMGPNPISNVTLHDVWPNSNCINYLDWTGSVGFTKDLTSLYWTNSNDLNPGETFTLFLYGSIKDDDACASNYINQVNLRYIELGKTYTDTAKYSFLVKEKPKTDVYLEKTADKNKVKSGDNITYTIKYKNVGNVALLSYTITDYWPMKIQYISSSPTAHNVVETSTGSILSWHFNTTLEPGQTGQIVIYGKVK